MQAEIVQRDRFSRVGDRFKRDGHAGDVGEDAFERSLIGPKSLGGDAAGEARPLAVRGADRRMKQVLLERAAAVRDRQRAENWMRLATVRFVHTPGVEPGVAVGETGQVAQEFLRRDCPHIAVACVTNHDKAARIAAGRIGAGASSRAHCPLGSNPRSRGRKRVVELRRARDTVTPASRYANKSPQFGFRQWIENLFGHQRSLGRLELVDSRPTRRSYSSRPQRDGCGLRLDDDARQHLSVGGEDRRGDILLADGETRIDDAGKHQVAISAVGRSEVRGQFCLLRQAACGKCHNVVERLTRVRAIGRLGPLGSQRSP